MTGQILPLILIAVLLMVIAIPLILKKIPKNAFYGLRTPKTLSGTDEQWYQANHEAGIGIFIAGFISLVACAVVPVVIHAPGSVVRICFFVFLASVLIACGIEIVKHWK